LRGRNWAHARTNVNATAANKARLADPAKVEKWFKRNCQDVLERACTAQEQGSFAASAMPREVAAKAALH
jgi:hypothetical protein